jgi:ribonuclease T2
MCLEAAGIRSVTFAICALFASTAVQAAPEVQTFSVPNTFPNLAACVNEPLVFSCENTTAIKNTCCSPTPGGLVLQTHYWDTYTGLEDQGQLLPKDSWTIHGLWPDNCDG